MKINFSLILLLLSTNFNVITNSDQTVTLTTTGQGETVEEARNNALRSAIEQAFGAFISSRTEIVNDELIRDEIISVSSGNIQNYQILNESVLPNEIHSSTINATVSVSNLTSFSKGKGIEIEFEGSLFAFNIDQQKLNEENEKRVLLETFELIHQMALKAFDYNISANTPVQEDNYTWTVPLDIEINTNETFNEIGNLLANTLRGLSLTNNEAQDYLSLNKDVYPVTVVTKDNNITYSILRTELGRYKVDTIIYLLGYYPLNLYINNNIHEIGFEELIDRLFLENNSSNRGSRQRYAKDLWGVQKDRSKSETDSGPVGLKHFNDLKYTPYYPERRFPSSYIANSFYYQWGQFGINTPFDFPVYRSFHRNITDYNNTKKIFSDFINERLKAERRLSWQSIYPKNDLIIAVETRRRKPNQLSQQDLPGHLKYAGFRGTRLDEMLIQNDFITNVLVHDDSRNFFISYNLGHFYNFNLMTNISIKYPDRLNIEDLRSVRGYIIHSRDTTNAD